MQNVHDYTLIEKAATASTALHSRQSEKLGILVNLFPKSHKLLQQQPVTLLPPAISIEHLFLDPDLLKDGNTASQTPDTVM